MPYESWAIVFHVDCSKCNPIFMILVLKCYQNRNLWQIDIAEFSEIGLERPLMTTRWSCMIEYTESSHKTYQLKGNFHRIQLYRCAIKPYNSVFFTKSSRNMSHNMSHGSIIFITQSDLIILIVISEFKIKSTT